MSSPLVLTPLVVLGLTLGFLLPVLLKLFKTCEVDDISPEWLEGFSCSSYYPMRGLFNDEDFDFLSRQPGFDLSLYRKLRRDRLKIFKEYLNRIIVDFQRLHVAARFLAAKSLEDRSDFVTRLFWLRMQFSFAVIQAQASYGLCCVGFHCLAVKAVISRLEDMRTVLGSIPATQAV